MAGQRSPRTIWQIMIEWETNIRQAHGKLEKMFVEWLSTNARGELWGQNVMEYSPFRAHCWSVYIVASFQNWWEKRPPSYSNTYTASRMIVGIISACSADFLFKQARIFEGASIWSTDLFFVWGAAVFTNTRNLAWRWGDAVTVVLATCVCAGIKV